MGEKISLSFVNNGKEFEIPRMTVKRQEKVLEMLAEFDKKKDLTEQQKNNEVNKMLVVDVLKSIDEKVSIDNINNMHPEDFIYLFSEIMSSGRELGDERKGFRKTK